MTNNGNLLASRLWPATEQSSLMRMAVLAILGSALVAIAAQISVPMIPVPMTLQTLAVLSIGAAYGARLGALTLGLYALEGIVGIPVFAEFKSGFMLVSFGYVIGFILAAYLVGYLVEQGWGSSIPKMLAAMLLGGAILYIPGLIWLSVWVGSVPNALAWGLYPFIPGDLIKAAVAALAFPAAQRLLGPRA